MNIVKPPYKFRIPYRTNDEMGKQGTVCGYEIVDFSKNPIEIIKVSNSEKNYYKKCTRDLSRKDLNTLRREFRKRFIPMGLQTILSMGNACNILEMLTEGKAKSNTNGKFKTTKMIEQIKQLRVEIDGLAQLCEGLKPIQHQIYVGSNGLVPSINTEEIKEAVKSLKLSKAWLGKVLENLGNENPYGSGYKTVEDIVPEADKAEIICGSIDPINCRSTARDAFTVAGKLVTENYGTHIEKVDWLRTEIKRLIDSTTDYSQEVPEIELEQGFAYKYLCEARFWLGFEMGRIKDESK